MRSDTVCAPGLPAGHDPEPAGCLRAVEVGAELAPAMRALFAERFGKSMSEAHWHWKYASGPGHAVALLDTEGALLAHYGGLTRPVHAFGERLLASQVCDVMVATRARRSLARRGPLYRVATRYIEGQVGWGRRHRIGFGFPNARHHAAAARLGLYEAVDRIVQLSWPARVLPLAERLQPVRLVDGRLDRAAARRIDRLWLAMAASLREKALGERDAGWVQWRYLDRPEVDYALQWVLSRWLRRPLGLLVLRRHADALELLDLVGPAPCWPLLVRAAICQAGLVGAPQLRLWVTASQRDAFSTADPEQAAHEEDLRIPVPTCIHTPGPAPALLRGRWFLMGGDADFT